MPMDGHTDNGLNDSVPDALRTSPASPGIGMSRRDFATKIGLGSAAAVGLAIGAPNIRTIAFATKAKAGSPAPRGGTTTTTSVPHGHGKIAVSNHSPCVDDALNVQASGFVPHTAVALELDSPGFVLGNTTADATGSIDVQITLTNSMAGTHKIVVSGIQAGGRALVVSASVHIKTEAECRQGPQGSTTVPGSPSTTISGATQSSTPGTSAMPGTSATSGTSGTPGSPGQGHGSQAIGGEHIQEGNGLAFTGTDAIDLALIGAAATVGGRLLYGLARSGDDEEEVDE
jgi:hypothetical protein